MPKARLFVNASPPAACCLVPLRRSLSLRVCVQAVRKAPQVAHGFRITASKWLIVVRLLLGEVPERAEFAQPGLFGALQPYFQLALAVKNGDLVAFAKVR